MKLLFVVAEVKKASSGTCGAVFQRATLSGIIYIGGYIGGQVIAGLLRGEEGAIFSAECRPKRPLDFSLTGKGGRNG